MTDPDTTSMAADVRQDQGPAALRSSSGKFIKPPHFTELEIDTLLKHESDSLHHRRYQVEGLIGVGATGEVFAVMDGSLERLVAVKLLRTELAREPDDIRSFIEEARITAKLSHPNVLPVHDLNVSEDGRPYFSMSRISGKTLGQILLECEKGSRPPGISTMNSIVNIFISICNAVNYAHHFGIIHQDIKPDNVLIGDFGEILLLDWGSAARIDGEGKVHTGIYGTPLYMSPEQARQEYSDVRSDIYCIGSALFHSLLLRIPSWSDDGDTFWDMKQKGLINQPTDQERKKVPAELLAISCKALASDPAQRYQTVIDLRRDLEHFQAGQAVSAHRESLLRWIARIYARNRNAIWIAMSALVVVALLLGALIRLQLKQRGSWIEMFHEQFDEGSKADLAKHWIVRTQAGFGGTPFKDVPIDEAVCVTLLPHVLEVKSQGEIVDLVCNQVIRGNFRVTWNCSAPQVAYNLNCFIGTNRESSFTFHIGGWGDSSSIVLTEGAKFERLQEARLPAPLTPGTIYHLRLEREERHLRLAIDDHLYIDYIDAESIGGQQGQTFGFDAYVNNRLMYSDIHVYHQSVPQIISPVEVGDKLFMLENWAEAERQYKEIAEDYPGSDLDLACRYRIALCEQRLKHDVTAGMLLDAFASSYPAHELAPYALYQRFQLAMKANDEHTIQRILHSMIAYRGKPVLGQVLDDLGGYRWKGFDRSKSVSKVLLYDIYPIDVVRRIDQIMIELRFYAEAFGVGLDHNPFPQFASNILAFVGEFEACWRLVPWDTDMHAFSLIHMGRMQEALQLPCSPAIRGLALFWLGRLHEVSRSHLYPDDLRASSYLMLGEFEALKEFDPNSDLCELALRQRGLFKEFLALHPTDSHGLAFGVTQHNRVLMAMGLSEQVVKEYTHPSAKAYALIQLGRNEEALALANFDIMIVSQAAIDYLKRGLRDKADPLIDALAREYSTGGTDGVAFSSYLLPEIVYAIHGDRDKAQRLWHAQITKNPLRFGQQVTFYSRYVMGEIGDEEFLRQPWQLLADVRLQEARAFRDDFQGRYAEAAAQYLQILKLPAWKTQLDDAVRAFMEWRAGNAGLTFSHAIGGNCLP